MRVTLAYRAVESLGLENISAVLKQAGHRVSLAFDPDLFGEDHYAQVPALQRRLACAERTAQQILDSDPQVVGFSVPTPYLQWALAIARALKAAGCDAPVVFGGAHINSVPLRVLRHDCVDLVLQGEADHSFPALLDELAAGAQAFTTPGVGWRGPDGPQLNPPALPPADLDALPLPDKALFEDWVPMGAQYRTMASRGCPYGCSFCAHSLPLERAARAAGSPAVRRMGVQRIMAELRWAHGRYGFRRVHFDDDVFTEDRSWLEGFCSSYRTAFPGVPFSCVTHPANLDADKARWLKEAGCTMLELGVETLDPAVRRDLLHRRESTEVIERALAVATAAGLTVQADHILSLPGEGEQSLLDTARFYARYGGQLRVALFHLTYYPNTAITRLAHERGWIDDARMDAIDEGLEGSIYHQGSVVDPAELRVGRDMQALFRIMPIAPRLGRRLLDSGAWRHLGALPWQVNVGLEALTAAVNRDPRALAYARFYLQHLPPALRASLRRSQP